MRYLKKDLMFFWLNLDSVLFTIGHNLDLGSTPGQPDLGSDNGRPDYSPSIYSIVYQAGPNWNGFDTFSNPFNRFFTVPGHAALSVPYGLSPHHLCDI